LISLPDVAIQNGLNRTRYNELVNEEKRENHYKGYESVKYYDTKQDKFIIENKLVSFNDYINIRSRNPLSTFIDYKNFCAKIKNLCTYDKRGIDFLKYKKYKEGFDNVNLKEIDDCNEVDYKIKKNTILYGKSILNDEIARVNKNKLILKNIIEKELERITYTKHEINMWAIIRDNKFYNNNWNYHNQYYLDIKSDGKYVRLILNNKVINQFSIDDYFVNKNTIQEKIQNRLAKDYKEINKTIDISICKSIGIEPTNSLEGYIKSLNLN
jgi:hypothetical protein